MNEQHVAISLSLSVVQCEEQQQQQQQLLSSLLLYHIEYKGHAILTLIHTNTLTQRNSFSSFADEMLSCRVVSVTLVKVVTSSILYLTFVNVT